MELAIEIVFIDTWYTHTIILRLTTFLSLSDATNLAPLMTQVEYDNAEYIDLEAKENNSSDILAFFSYATHRSSSITIQGKVSLVLFNIIHAIL